MKRILLILIIVLWQSVVWAQISVKGKITDVNGKGVEYVSVGVDSLFTISDVDGYFELKIPDGHTAPMIFHHISYRTQQLPFDTYKSGSVSVKLEEDIYNLSNVIISNKELKEKTISHKGFKAPGDVGFNNIRNSIYEIGPIVNNKNNYLVRSFNFKVEECTYSYCTVRIIVYEVNDKKITPVQHKPIYIDFSDKKQFTEHTVEVKEDILLKKNQKYYIGLAVVSSSGKGTIHFPAYIRKGYVRNLTSGKIKKLPATIGLSMKGFVF